jgi:type I restriction enzyme S subunit
MSTQSLKPGWNMVKFGDIAQSVAVRVDPAEAKTDVYVGLEHLDPSTIHLRQWGHPSDVTGQKLAFKKGDVIFGRRRAYQRKLAVAEFDGICSAHAMVVRAKPKMILPEFLPFFLQSDMFMERAIEISVGSLSPTINWKTLREQVFPLPPLDEQKRVAEILWAADEAVEKWKITLEQQLNLRDAALKDIYQCDVSGNTVESPRERIKTCKIQEVAKVFSGGTPSRKNKSFWEGGEIPWIKTGEVNYYDIRDTEEKITPIAVEKSAAKMVPPDTVLVAMYGQGPTRGRVGYTVIDASINQACAAIVVNKNVLRPRYVYYYLTKEYENMRSMGHGAAQPNINAGMVKNFAIPTPSLKEQDEALTLIGGINTRIEEIRNHIECLNSTVKALGNNMIGAAHV